MVISVNNKLSPNNSKELNLKLSASDWEPLDADFLSPSIDSNFFKRGLYFAKLFNYSENKSHGNTDFSTISAIVLDYDGKSTSQLSSTAAMVAVKSFNFKAFIVSGPSYVASGRDSYRLIIPLAEPINAIEFVTLINLINDDPVYGKGLDETCAAMRFWAPTNGDLFFKNDAKVLANQGELFAILNAKKGAKKLKEAYDKTITRAIETNTVNADKVHNIFDNYADVATGSKSPLICPFCDPANRKNASFKNAFISKTASGRLFLYCSSENKTYWKDVDYNVLLKPFISYGDSVYKFGLSEGNNKLVISKIGRDKFHVFTNTVEKTEANKAWKALILNKHFEELPKVEYHCGLHFTERKIRVDSDPIIVEIPPIAATFADNDYVNEYIEKTFNEYSEFIKDWLTLYAYTNYTKLPTLIFTGGRSTGKTSFAEIVGTIYPGQSTMVNNVEREFTGFVESKLLIIDESVERGKNQYSILKMLSGSAFLEINKKYKEPFLIRNNLNIIVTSNDPFPLYIEANELPADETRNQFFAYAFPTMPAGVLDTGVPRKVSERLVHWLNTEGKARLARLEPQMAQNRYSLPVPITEKLKTMFESSISPMAYKAEECIGDWKMSITKIDDAYIDNDFIKTWCKKEKVEFAWLLKEMRKLNYIGKQKSKYIMKRVIKMHKVILGT